jgi:dTDP-4-dehydrorhamnose reductase
VPADIELHVFARADLDIEDAARVAARIEHLRPDLVINAAGYTAVDKAESDPGAARRGNLDGPRNVAVALARLQGARMIHLSTDFVFDGEASRPYAPDAEARPLGVYGETKLAGERAVREALGDRAVILRTAWVYSASGHNFALTMLRHMARGPVRVVADQVGTPTAAASLAKTIWSIARSDAGGTFHWTDAGVASWYDFAVAIAEEATQRGLLSAPPRVTAIATAEFPTPARRPPYSVLDKSATISRFGLQHHEHWRVGLRDVIEELCRA